MKERHERVFAVYPTASGLGWALFEGEKRIVDWGVAVIHAEMNAKCLARIDALIEKRHPTVIAIEQYDGPESRRKERIKKLYPAILRLANTKGITAKVYPRSEINACFSNVGRATRYAIAREVAARVPVLAPELPPKRKIWLPEDPRMGLFCAAAIALAHYFHAGKAPLAS